MRRAWLKVVVIVVGVLVLGGGALRASAQGNTTSVDSTVSSAIDSAERGATNLAHLLGIGEENTVPPGTLDDGKELLPQAKLSVEQAVQAARTAASGPVGEVDLEHFQGRLVFNVDVGDRDVKVDAENGSILSADSEE